MNGCEIFEAEFFDPVSAIAQTDFLHAYLRNPSSFAGCLLPGSTPEHPARFLYHHLSMCQGRPHRNPNRRCTQHVPRCNAKRLASLKAFDAGLYA
jgi:hypothetical protein